MSVYNIQLHSFKYYTFNNIKNTFLFISIMNEYTCILKLTKVVNTVRVRKLYKYVKVVCTEV